VNIIYLNIQQGTNLIVQAFFDYEISGFGGDAHEARLKVRNQLNQNEQTGHTRMTQVFRNENGGGTRSGTLNGNKITTNSNYINETSVRIILDIRKQTSGSDSMVIREGYFLVYEITN